MVNPPPKFIYWVGRGRFRFLCPKIDGLNNKWFSREPPQKCFLGVKGGRFRDDLFDLCHNLQVV